MEFEALKDFELYSKVSEDIIVKYEGKIPEQFINIWKKYGFGQFLQGYFKLVNPVLSLGGLEKSENLQNVKLREHLELMYQMQGCI